MIDAQMKELQTQLVRLCPDYVGIEVTHLGQYRVKITAVMFNGAHTHVVMSLSDDHTPKEWATVIVQQLHSSQTV